MCALIYHLYQYLLTNSALALKKVPRLLVVTFLLLRKKGSANEEANASAPPPLYSLHIRRVGEKRLFIELMTESEVCRYQSDSVINKSPELLFLIMNLGRKGLILGPLGIFLK